MDIVKSETINIRAFQANDTVEFTAACLESYDTLGKWMPWCHREYSCDEAMNWISQCTKEIEAGNSYDFGIFRNSDARLIGSVAINQLDHRNKIGNIGYWVRESLQRQGYAKQAVELIRRYGFEELLLVRLEIVVAMGNIASKHVALSAGAEFECVAKNRLIIDGQTEPAAVYSFTTVS